MLTSKQLLETTGISRATLNNYIVLGILPKPIVKRPTTPHARARRLGYFPDDVVERVNTVRQLKADGLSMEEIAARFRRESKAAKAPLADSQSRRETQDISGASRSRREDGSTAAPTTDDGPVRTRVCVLAAELEHTARLRAELPSDEYVELIERILHTVGRVVVAHDGVPCDTTGGRLAAYFVPSGDDSYLFNALLCAQAIRTEMQTLSGEWRSRKSWTNELRLNVGLNAADDWLASICSLSGLKITVLGDSLEHAAKLSRFARSGAIWATKSLIDTLTREERARIRFGVRSREADSRERLVPGVYARVGDLIDLADPRSARMRDIAALAVTEVLEIEGADPLPPTRKPRAEASDGS